MSTRDLTGELRAARPVAPDALRERVRAFAAAQPALRPRVWERFAWRRAALVLVASMLLAGLGAALVRGLVSAGSDPVPAQKASRLDVAWPDGPRTHLSQVAGARDRVTLSRTVSPAGAYAERGAHPLPVSRGRLQAYDAYLRLRVRDVEALSAATSRAMRLARSLGGYVVSVRYRTPGQEGTAALRLRLPITRVQEAVGRLSALGTVLGQGFHITDLERTATVQRDRIAILSERISRLRERLRTDALSPGERVRLQYQLDAARRQLAGVRHAHAQTVKRGRLATVSLALTTHDPAADQGDAPGRIERALDDAGSVLATEVAWIVYALVVAAPVALLAFAALLLTRLARRRSDRLLLERP